MKIRIKGNSLRYRLTKSEVAALAEQGRLSDRTEFAGGSLSYAIQQSEDQHLKADLENNAITLYVPQHLLRTWAGTDQVGLEHTDNGLYLLLEKDFKCIDADVSEDQSDYFENPQISC